jgi:hypothetical protein
VTQRFHLCGCVLLTPSTVDVHIAACRCAARSWDLCALQWCLMSWPRGEGCPALVAAPAPSCLHHPERLHCSWLTPPSHTLSHRDIGIDDSRELRLILGPLVSEALTSLLPAGQGSSPAAGNVSGVPAPVVGGMTIGAPVALMDLLLLLFAPRCDDMLPSSMGTL